MTTNRFIHALFKPRVLVLLILFVSGLIYALNSGYHRVVFEPHAPSDSAIPPKSETARRLRMCLMTEIETYSDNAALWKNLSDIVTTCRKRSTTLNDEDFISFKMGRFGERKYFLPIALSDSQLSTKSCFELTIGIGGDSHVEKEMKLKYPKCQIFGIEPSPDQYEHFETYGKVIPLAAGITPGVLQMTVRVGTAYKKKNVQMTPLPDILDLYVKSRTIHFATIDIEGFDYELIEALRHGRPFAQRGVTFCQLDVEFHDLRWRPSNFSFTSYFMGLLNDSWYLPMHANNFLTHRKVTFIHTASRECEEMFQFSRWI